LAALFSCNRLASEARAIASETNAVNYGSSKNNPLLSMWLSAANTWASAARGFWMAEFQRQQSAMMREATEQMVRFWTGAWMLPGASVPRKQRR
jgi:hypothetical protein